MQSMEPWTPKAHSHSRAEWGFHHTSPTVRVPKLFLKLNFGFVRWFYLKEKKIIHTVSICLCNIFLNLQISFCLPFIIYNFLGPLTREFLYSPLTWLHVTPSLSFSVFCYIRSCCCLYHDHTSRVKKKKKKMYFRCRR